MLNGVALLPLVTPVGKVVDNFVVVVVKNNRCAVAWKAFLGYPQKIFGYEVGMVEHSYLSTVSTASTTTTIYKYINSLIEGATHK